MKFIHSLTEEHTVVPEVLLEEGVVARTDKIFILTETVTALVIWGQIGGETRMENVVVPDIFAKVKSEDSYVST